MNTETDSPEMESTEDETETGDIEIETSETEELESEEVAVEQSEDPVEEEDEVRKWRDLAMRNQADLENYRKRMAREKSEAIQYANVSLLRGLLPILDNFEMGLEAARAEGEDSVIFQGMEMVRKQIEEFLREEGVETVDSVGADFDPNQHEAVQQEFSDDVPEGKIISELRRGFRMKDRLLRAANVIISKGPETEAGSED